MKKVLPWILFFSIVSASLASEKLLVVKNLSPEEHSSLFVIKTIGDDYLIIANELECEQLATRGRSFSFLDESPREKLYFIVGKCVEPDSAIAQFARIVGKVGPALLIETTQDMIDSLNTLRLSLSLVEFKKVLPYNSEPDETFRQSNPNEEIAKLCALISIDSMRADIKKMQYYPSRHATLNSGEVTKWLASRLKSYCDTVYLENFSSTYGPNIIGIKKGKTNSLTEYCVIGAHFDAVKQTGLFKAAGADDNASGTAAVIECARLLKNRSCEKTIKFVLFNAEEVGLIGSKAFAQNMSTAKHILVGGAVTFDMIGHSSKSKNTVLIEGTDKVAGNASFITSYLTGMAKNYTDLLCTTSVAGFGSDHESFWAHGYKSVLLNEKDWNVNPSYHKDFDTLDCPNGLNDMPLMRKITTLGLAATAEQAGLFKAVPILADQNNGVENNSAWSLKKAGVSVELSISVNAPESVDLFNMRGAKIATANRQYSQESGGRYSFATIPPGLYVAHWIHGNSRSMNVVVKF